MLHGLWWISSQMKHVKQVHKACIYNVQGVVPPHLGCCFLAADMLGGILSSLCGCFGHREGGTAARAEGCVPRHASDMDTRLP